MVVQYSLLSRSLIAYLKTAIISSFLFASLFFVSCTKSDLSTDTKVDSEPASTVPVTVNKTVMLQLVNEVRKKGCQCGDTYYYPATSVSWNNQLETAAYGHSEDMYSNKFFDHTAPDGSNGGVRIQQAGYNWMTYGENIAMGYKSEREVLDGWLQSPGHCKNIMNKVLKKWE